MRVLRVLRVWDLDEERWYISDKAIASYIKGDNECMIEYTIDKKETTADLLSYMKGKRVHWGKKDKYDYYIPK